MVGIKHLNPEDDKENPPAPTRDEVAKVIGEATGITEAANLGRDRIALTSAARSMGIPFDRTDKLWEIAEGSGPAADLTRSMLRTARESGNYTGVFDAARALAQLNDMEGKPDFNEKDHQRMTEKAQNLFEGVERAELLSAAATHKVPDATVTFLLDLATKEGPAADLARVLLERAKEEGKYPELFELTGALNRYQKLSSEGTTPGSVLDDERRRAEQTILGIFNGQDSFRNR